jgi:hypothetical protein
MAEVPIYTEGGGYLRADQTTLGGITAAIPEVTLVTPTGGSVEASSSATLTTVAASTSTGVLLALNTARTGASVMNDSTSGTLYLAFAATASTSAYTVKIAPGQFYELPTPVYTGAVSGIWDIASGNARISELT